MCFGWPSSAGGPPPASYHDLEEKSQFANQTFIGGLQAHMMSFYGFLELFRILGQGTIQIYKILQERGVQNIIPWGSLNYDAYRTCVRGIKYSSIRTANAMTRSIDEKKFAILSGGTFCRVVRS
ncbi:hypothetical protein ASPBRDRAFT_487678 [Aspergillus brasiliensis CBS 101740]|uniref:Uncharacterized protein n=1 Tax=Aspergillus brasiliensis (strain CBS 101740 / IMI 381727 / IBT 21946) TaxID=767769 RepID=A0A1L9U267_ASPBC|nr:hypothetical protein ASPBRDRAFT_487678 [Aspergillus brasiliensis CBS 101740]